MKSTLLACPLAELRRRAARLARCDGAHGARLPNAPWAFQLASPGQAVGSAPVVKTVGFQCVSEAGIDFLVRRGSGAQAGGQFAASFCYVEGQYPPAEGGACEQWRGEGEASEVPPGAVLSTAPLGSFAQILACQARAGGSGGGDECGGGSGGRVALADRETFVREVGEVKARLEGGRG